LAVISQGNIQKINQLSRKSIKKEDWDKSFKKSLPWSGFKEEVEQRLESLNVVRFPVKKISGEFHKETIYGHDEGEYFTKRVSIYNLSSSTVENIQNKDKDNKNLYEQLVKFIDSENFKNKKPFILKQKKGKLGQVVKKVKVVDKKSNIRNIEGRGIITPSNMVRVDIYSKVNKGNTQYYGVPQYSYDIARGIESKEITGSSAKREYVDDSYNFCFSLYKNDIIYMDDGIIKSHYYFVSYHRRNKQVNLTSLDKSKINNKIEIAKGILNLKKFEKHQIDYFGNIYQVNEA